MFGFGRRKELEGLTIRQYHSKYGVWPTTDEIKSRLDIDKYVDCSKIINDYRKFLVRNSSYIMPNCIPSKPIIKRVATPCPCCGSREYVTHNAISICSYCRTPNHVR